MTTGRAARCRPRRWRRRGRRRCRIFGFVAAARREHEHDGDDDERRATDHHPATVRPPRLLAGELRATATSSPPVRRASEPSRVEGLAVVLHAVVEVVEVLDARQRQALARVELDLEVPEAGDHVDLEDAVPGDGRAGSASCAAGATRVGVPTTTEPSRMRRPAIAVSRPIRLSPRHHSCQPGCHDARHEERPRSRANRQTSRIRRHVGIRNRYPLACITPNSVN